MNFRLRRIETLVLVLSAICALGAGLSKLTPAAGVVIGGFAVWLDFVVIRELATGMLTRNVPKSHLLPMALAKSLALILVPALALFLPSRVVDGVSFAIGVTTLPLAIVVDACMAPPHPRTGDV